MTARPWQPTKFESEIIALLRSLPGGEATTRAIAGHLAPSKPRVSSLPEVIKACQRLAGLKKLTCRWSDDDLERTWRLLP